MTSAIFVFQLMAKKMSEARRYYSEHSVLDPLTLSIVRHKLQALAEEMVETMTHTCFSPILNLNQDFSSVVLDREARTLAQAERVPIHVGAMPFAIKTMMSLYEGDIQPGDIIMANDPFYGGSHLPDITLAKPVFWENEIQFWVSLRAHQGDIGGISAGGYSPSATEIWHEGLRIPPIKLVTGGTLREDVMRLVAANSRRPDDLRGDVMAQLASVLVGAKGIETLLQRYGANAVSTCGDAILDAGEAAMRRSIQKCQKKSYEGIGFLETGDVGNILSITAKVEFSDGKVSVDLTDCPEQQPSFINSPIANTVSAVYVAFLYIFGDEQVFNSGIERVIEIRTRPGSLLDPVLPAAVVGCTSLTSVAIIEAVLKALSEAMPNSAISGFARRFRFALAGTDRNDDNYIWHFFFNRGGAGANRMFDGWPNLGGIHNPGGTPAPSVEQTEAAYPLLIEEYSLRPDSGGSGAKRGGLGGKIILKYEGEVPAIVNAAGDGVSVPPYGLFGGSVGAMHNYRIERANGDQINLGVRDHGVVLTSGDRIICFSAGGGGIGSPDMRSPAEAQRDLSFGYTTA